MEIKQNRTELLIAGPPSEKDFQEWLWVVLGVWLPNRSVCSGHCSPLEYVTDNYYEHVLDSLLWAARIWGKSFDAALLCWLKARYKQVWEANICAGSAAQAGRVYKAADMFWRATDDISGRAVLRKEPLKTYTEFLNGSMYEITTSSTKAQRGPHPNALFADEIDEMEVDILNSALEQTTDQHGHKGTNSLMSTMHKVGQLMSYWVDNAEIKGYKLYISCILEVLESCLDYRCDNCNIDPYCERKLQPIAREEHKRQVSMGLILPSEHPKMGHNTVENIQRKIRQGYETDETTGQVKILDVAAELFCKRPSRTGLVFPDFNENFHIVPAQEIHIETGWKKARTTDFGFSAPFVDLYFAITPRDQIIFYYELVQAGMSMPDIIEHLKEGRRHTAFLMTFGDPAGATEIDTIRKAGIPIKPVVSEIQEGIMAISHLLRQNVDGKPQFIISSACPVFISEIKKLSYPENGLSEKPIKKDDHCVEAARRGVVAWLRGQIESLNKLLEGVVVVKDKSHLNTGTDRTYDEVKKAAIGIRKGRSGRRERPRGVSDYL